MNSHYIALSAIAAICMTAALAAPAQADEWSGPTVSCGSNRHIDITSNASGTVKHYAPSGTLRATYSNSGLVNRRTHTTVQSANWRVTATGAIVAADAFCDDVAP